MLRLATCRGKDTAPITLGWVQRYVVTTLRVDGARVKKVLVKVVHKLEDVAFHRARNGDIVDQAGKASVSGR